MEQAFPLELQVYIWQLLHNKRIQDIHTELKSKVQRTPDDWWGWSFLHYRGDGWKRIIVDSEDWSAANWGKPVTDAVACDRLLYLKSYGKCLVYKNCYYLFPYGQQQFKYKLRREVYDSPWN